MRAAKSLGIALLDYDDDGWLDLLVTNDTQPNKLYRNNHNGTFTDVAVRGQAWPTAMPAPPGRAWAWITATMKTPATPGLVIGNFTNEGMALYRAAAQVFTPPLPITTGIDLSFAVAHVQHVLLRLRSGWACSTFWL